MTIDHDEAICESEAARLLPWLVTGRLAAADAARVEAHLSACPVCRADLEAQRTLRDAVRADDRVEYSPQPGLQKLMSRIDEMDREFPSGATISGAAPPARSGSQVMRWLVAALVVQAIGIGLLGSALWQRSGTDAAPAYRTLTSAPAASDGAPQLRVVFAPHATITDLAELVASVHGTIVAGPSPAGAYTLALPGERMTPDGMSGHVARLRSDPRVLFAEPVVTAGGSPQ